MAKPGKFFNRSNNTNAPKSVAPATPLATATVPQQAKPAENIIKPGAKAELKPNQGNISRDAVAEAAYFLWLQRGGNETVNWLEAEAMLAGKIVTK